MPGFTRKWISAIFALSVNTGSTTIMVFRVFAELLQEGSGARYAVRVPGFSPKKSDIAVVEVTFDHGPEHLSIDPELAGLFLRQALDR